MKKEHHSAKTICFQRILQQDFDMSLAFCNHEKKQRSDDAGSQAPSAGKQLSRKMSLDSPSSTDSKSMEASTSMSADINSGVNSSSKPTERHFLAPYCNCLPMCNMLLQAVDFDRQPSVASSTLVELTARLDFFKERRSQLMKQLHSLDLSHGGASSQGLRFKASPPWASPR
ncbi:unnamed protein product [Spirodela intermedia]|uniref:Uncharacterized protein n=2 Tax=Spirodela intermedia TaxID=51605 RepID=A0A7I8IAY4_SPIIN|nr:unnamed protein product [Spirodela intermedia]CAA6654051.1 unnamed protein product [Spirodela intermedia]CAA7388516.1 unnamed protein product [Spirodela intermedia]